MSGVMTTKIKEKPAQIRKILLRIRNKNHENRRLKKREVCNVDSSVSLPIGLFHVLYALFNISNLAFFIGELAFQQRNFSIHSSY
jgi:hypothetical protein